MTVVPYDKVATCSAAAVEAGVSPAHAKIAAARLQLHSLTTGTFSWRVQLIWLGSCQRPFLLRQLSQDQRALDALVVVKHADGPKRAAGCGVNGEELVVRVAAIRAADDAPTRAIPQFRQRARPALPQASR